MNILILTRIWDNKQLRKCTEELELALPRLAPEHNYLVHNSTLPLPAFVKDVTFHGVILTSTFLSARYNMKSLNKALREYEFLKNSDSYKIAMPQDDYDCSALLDEWMTEWSVDSVHTVIPEHWEVLYPNYSRGQGRLSLGYTGYISPELADRAAKGNPHELRGVDVGYRAGKMPPWYGRMGMVKSQIAPKFVEIFGGKGFKLDISIYRKDNIPGGKWLDFVADCRFVIGSNSGSGLLDQRGEIRRDVEKFQRDNPEASFEEVEAACFPGLDGKYIFTAISPRVYEAAVLKTGQILVPGPYSGVIKPREHYIPMNEDCSNVDEIIDALKDFDGLARMTKSCAEALMSVPELRLENHAAKVLEEIGNAAKNQNAGMDRDSFQRFSSKYQSRMKLVTPVVSTMRKLKSFAAESTAPLRRAMTG